MYIPTEPGCDEDLWPPCKIPNFRVDSLKSELARLVGINAISTV